MRAIVLTMFVLVIIGSCFAQSQPKYQTGTIVDVKEHQAATSSEQATQYDVTVRVGSTIYVVVYTPPNGSDTVKYRVGIDGPVLIEGDTMKFSDIMGNTISLPIVSHKPAPAKKQKATQQGN